MIFTVIAFFTNLLLLPKPTGPLAIDAKFPLETYRRAIAGKGSEAERKEARKAFRASIHRHIQDVASKYIVPGETTDGALLFIPAEAVFAEIHAHYPDLVTEAHRSNVWLVSPTTLMAVLTTALAVIKDKATQRQAHLIQKHLSHFTRDARHGGEQALTGFSCVRHCISHLGIGCRLHIDCG